MTISSVTSESLQLKLRQLLPSQQGFGTDLSASDTIIPVIDLTAAAEGSDVPIDLQQAIAFGSQTAFSAINATVVIANTAGFFRIMGAASITGGTGSRSNDFTMTDGATVKTIWSQKVIPTGTILLSCLNFDFIVFLATGDSISATTNTAFDSLVGSSRQIADVNGTPVQPVGFTPQ